MVDGKPIRELVTPNYRHAGQLLLAGTSLKNWRNLLEKSFAGCLLLPTASGTLEFSLMLTALSPYPQTED